MPDKESCNTLKLPFCSAICCKKMMFSTIQPIGNKPVKPPYIAALPAISAGMPYAKMATTSAATKPKPAAMWALMCMKPKATNITTTGIAANKVDTTMLLNGS